MKGLIKIVQKLLKSMLSETEKCPSQIRQVFEYMSEETVKKMATRKHKQYCWVNFLFEMYMSSTCNTFILWIS